MGSNIYMIVNEFNIKLTSNWESKDLLMNVLHKAKKFEVDLNFSFKDIRC